MMKIEISRAAWLIVTLALVAFAQQPDHGAAAAGGAFQVLGWAGAQVNDFLSSLNWSR